jgi:hypothetical protein
MRKLCISLIVWMVLTISVALSQTWRMETVSGQMLWADRLDTLIVDTLTYYQGTFQARLPIDSIRRVLRQDHYGITGLWLGAGTGFTLAFVLKPLGERDGSHGDSLIEIFTPIRAVIYGLIGGGVGGIIGSTIRTEQILDAGALAHDEKRSRLQTLILSDN